MAGGEPAALPGDHASATIVRRFAIGIVGDSDYVADGIAGGIRSRAAPMANVTTDAAREIR